MKACKYFLLLLIAITLNVFSQSGYYPPPSSVFFHNDTLTIYPPDSLPGEPVELLGYNVYVDSVFFNNILEIDPEDTIDFIFEIPELLPGNHEFCAMAFYNEWISDAACDTGQVVYGFELPFLEDWSSGNFEENLWVSTSGNWVVEDEDGNPAPAVKFNKDPVQTYYSSSLESYPVIAIGQTIGRIWLDFNIKLEAVDTTGDEQLLVQVWNWATNTWSTVEIYSNEDGSFDWNPAHINISSPSRNKVFRVRFLASGVNSSDINNWSIDNIHVYRKCDGIYDLQLEEHFDFNRLDWMGYGGGCIDEWLHWDDGVNAGNSIGTGGAVEFDVAARWDHEQLGNYDSTYISEVAFFPAEVEASYNIRIWTGEDPDTMLVDQPVDSPVIGQWNYVELVNPVVIEDTKDLWVGYHVNTPAGYPAGVDDGPGINGYGNMMYFEGAWQTLLEINPELDMNWNIAFHVLPGLPYPDTLWFYKIYRQTDNGEFEFLGATSAWHYQDTTIALEDFYCYAVTAVWTENNDTCESSFQATACEYLMLGTGQQEQVQNIRIYPNPAKNIINIESEEAIREVRIYNPLGEMILKLEIGNLEGQVDVSSLENGIYFVEVLTDKMSYKDKVLIFR